MPKTLVVVNRFNGFQATVASMGETLGLPVSEYIGVKGLAADLNSNALPPENVALLVITGYPEQRDPEMHRLTMNFIRQLRNKPKYADIPILFLANRGDSNLAEACTECGITYLSLPVKKSDILSCSAGLCRGSEQTDGSAPITIGQNEQLSGSERLDTGAEMPNPWLRQDAVTTPITIGQNDEETVSEHLKTNAPITIADGKTSVEPITIGHNPVKPRSEQAENLPPITIGEGIIAIEPITIGLDEAEPGPAPITISRKTSKQGSEQDKKTTTESERRVATVMFADISGFTAMSEKMDPEEVTRIMNGVFREMETVIKAHGGMIDKFIGDCVMVLFGVPRALENAPLMAVNTAIEMRNALYCYNKENKLAIPLDIHIGMNTGPVIAGHVGGRERTDFTVMGDAVNLASRVEGVSEKGQILVGPDSYHATQDDFEYRALPPVALKGKAEPVPVYELLSVKEKAARRITGQQLRDKTGSDRMIFSELVGRDDEMNELRFQVMKLIKGEGSIITIVGEAGIGKSRLMAELKADPAMKKVTLLEGRAISMGRTLSFHTVIDLLKSWAGITEGDGDAAQFSKLEKAVRTVHPDEADEIIPFAATLMGMTLSGKHAERVKGIEGEAMEKLIFKNIRELLIKGSAIRPMVIYLEDLHWADTSSIELLNALFRLTDNYRILFILVFRPNYEETNDRTLKTLVADFHDRYLPLHIDPLTEDETALLINNLLNISGLPRALEEQIKDRAGGNPFFIEEVVRSLIDEGAVVKKENICIVTDKIHSITIPMTINEVLMGRIDRLDEETRNLVKTASVIGRNFFHKIITEVAQNVSDIDQRLSYLEDIQIIHERKRVDELEYLFKHALAQEAAYESILIQRRKELHLHVAQAIENVFTERLHEFFGMLAYHYSRGDNLDKAEEFMLKAGEEAMKSSASSEALQYFKEAHRIYEDKYGQKADRIKLMNIEKNIAIAYYNKGRYFEAADIFRRLLDYYYRKKSRIIIVKLAMNGIGLLHFLTACYFPSVKFKKTPTDRDKLVIDLYFYRLQSLYFIDSHQMFLELFDYLKLLTSINITKYSPAGGMAAALPAILSATGVSYSLASRLLKLLKNRIDTSDALTLIWYENSKLLYSFYSGHWELHEEFNESILETALDDGLCFPVSGYLAWQSNFDFERGQFDKFEDLLKKMNDLAIRYDHGFARMVYYSNSVAYLLGVRRLDKGISEADEGISLAIKLNEEFTYIQLYSFRSYLCLLRGDINESLQSLTLAGEKMAGKPVLFWTQAQYYRSEFNYYLFQVELMLRTGNRPALGQMKMKAKRSANKWLKNASKSPIVLQECYGNIASYFWFTGRIKMALRCWGKSIDIGEKLNSKLHLSRTYFEIGKRLLEKPLTEKHDRLQPIARALAEKILGLTAAECLERARTMFREMDLQWDLEELKKTLNNITLQI